MVFSKFNENHDPENGQFTSGGGGGGGGGGSLGYGDNSDYPDGDTSTSEYWNNRSRQLEEDRRHNQITDSDQRELHEAEKQAAALDARAVDSGLSLDEEKQRGAAYAKAGESRRRIQEKETAQFRDLWSPDQTVARREKWNDLVTSGKYTSKLGKIEAAGLARLEHDAGFTYESLKRAVTVNNLPPRSKSPNKAQTTHSHKSATGDTERKTFTGVEIKKDRPGAFTARIATLNVIDKDGDRTLPGAFPNGKTILISAYMHGSWMGELPVGKGIIREAGEDVFVDGEFNLDSETGREHYATVKFAPELQEWSYGYKVLEHERDKEINGNYARRVQGLMGHENIKTTQRYIASLDAGLIASEVHKTASPVDRMFGGEQFSPAGRRKVFPGK